ncbi:MAG: rubredoxin [Clostridia bacterium]|nr:rubredoxin [Clostridia bacterium]
MKKYVCMICGFIYDEAAGIPSAGIAPGTEWQDLPEDWVCPLCGAAKTDFEEQQEQAAPKTAEPAINENDGELRELSPGELAALCSNLAKGCEKQYLKEEAALFSGLADYFTTKTPATDKADFGSLLELIQKDLNEGYLNANAVAKAKSDRGAQRALVWGEKVTRILNSLLSRYEKEGDALIKNTNVYVCEVCGFLYIGDTPPELCPVCKVPSRKLTKIERG